jgi:DNA-binding transcriptional ArsR family regulator
MRSIAITLMTDILVLDPLKETSKTYMQGKGHNHDTQVSKTAQNSGQIGNFVLEKSIFSNIFEKDIRRVYIYKKAERLAKAIHLITPAFRHSPALRDRLDLIAVGIIDAATLPVTAAKSNLSRELLTLSSVLAIARTGGMLSDMNADLISREAHALLQEVAAYEEPRLFLDEAPSLAELAKSAHAAQPASSIERKIERAGFPVQTSPASVTSEKSQGQSKGQVKDNPAASGRRDAILSVLRSKGSLSIKDLSTVIRDVSEKTIQRELQSLVNEGLVTKSGERRWTIYALAS